MKFEEFKETDDYTKPLRETLVIRDFWKHSPTYFNDEYALAIVGDTYRNSFGAEYKIDGEGNWSVKNVDMGFVSNRHTDSRIRGKKLITLEYL